MTTEPNPLEADADFVPSLPVDVDFWDTPQMQTIRQAAAAKMVPEMAMVALTLTALTAEIDPRVRIDSRGDGNPHEYGNLNIFTAAVGRSGAGKSEAVRTARYLVGRQQATRINPSSGESVLTGFKDQVPVRVIQMDPDTGKLKVVPEKRYVWVSRACLMVVDESMNLSALSQRHGTTLMGTLNTAWSGGDLQNSTSGKEYRRFIPEGGYRLSGLVSAQPNATDSLLGKDAENGTTQRFIFVKVTFPPEYEWPETKPKLPEPLDLGDLPSNFWVDNYENSQDGAELNDDDIYDHGQAEPIETIHAMQVPQAVIKEMDDRARRSKMDNSDDPLDGHRAYNQLKVASAFALLHGRVHVEMEDWERASEVMFHSQELRRFFEQEAQTQFFEKARSEGRRNVIVSEASADAVRYNRAKLVANTARRHSTTEKCAEGCQSRCMRDALKARGTKVTAPLMEAALDLAEKMEWVTVDPGENPTASGTLRGYRFKPGAKRP